eukprot:jgi/Mesen1/3409/ME000192S02574
MAAPEVTMAMATTTTSAPPTMTISSPSSSYQQLRSVRDSLQDVLARALEMKRASAAAAPAPGGSTEVRRLTTEAAVMLVELRGLNRAILREEEAVKGQTEAAKGPVDSTTLRLHNLLYERNHYQKAIKACQDFRSQFPEIELAPLEEKELSKRREELQHRKRLLQASIAGTQKFLAGLPGQLKALKKASYPLQEKMSLPLSQRAKQQQHAELLPAPLYILYCQLAAHRDAFGDSLESTLPGEPNGEPAKEEDVPEDDEDAQRRRKRAKRSDAAATPPPVAPSPQALAEAVHPLKVVLHVYDEGAQVPPGGGAAGTGAGAGASVGAGKGASEGGPAQGGQGKASPADSSKAKEAKETKVLPLVTVTFEYVPRLQVVLGAASGDHEHVLANLFPDDYGLELPHQAAKLKTAGAAPSGALPGRAGRPYRWAQHLAGYDFLPEVPPAVQQLQQPQQAAAADGAIAGGLAQYRAQHRVNRVVQQLRSRFHARQALKEQLEALRRLRRPLPPSRHRAVGLASVWKHTPRSALVSWAPISSPPPGQQQQLGTTAALLGATAGAAPAASGASPLALGALRVPAGDSESGQEDGELPSGNPPGAQPAPGPGGSRGADDGGPPAAAPMQPLALAISEAARLRNAASSSMRPPPGSLHQSLSSNAGNNTTSGTTLATNANNANNATNNNNASNRSIMHASHASGNPNASGNSSRPNMPQPGTSSRGGNPPAPSGNLPPLHSQGRGSPSPARGSLAAATASPQRNPAAADSLPSAGAADAGGSADVADMGAGTGEGAQGARWDQYGAREFRAVLRAELSTGRSSGSHSSGQVASPQGTPPQQQQQHSQKQQKQLSPGGSASTSLRIEVEVRVRHHTLCRGLARGRGGGEGGWPPPRGEWDGVRV